MTSSMCHGINPWPISIVFLFTNREMNDNRITSLPSNVFKDQGTLRDLYLEYNSISWLPNGVFQNKHYMEFL